MKMERISAGIVLGALLFATSYLCAQTHASREAEIQKHAVLARKYAAENKPAAAIPEYRAIVRLDPQNVDARANLGVLLFFTNQYADANTQLRAALRMKPDLWRIQALLGMSEHRTGELTAARTDLENAFANLTDPKIRVESGMELIEVDYALNDLDKAASVVGVLRRLEPANPEILYTAYRIYSELSNEAMLSLGLVAPQSPQMHLVMAHEMARQNNIPGAIAQYRAAIHQDPQLPGVHYELAEALNFSDNPTLQAQAEGEYKAALRVDRFDEKSDCRLADILMKQGNMQQAAQYYRKALKLQPKDAEAGVGLARILVLMNDSQQALPILEKAVEEDPTNPVAHYRLSLLYRQNGETAKASEEMAKFKQYSSLRKGLRHLFEEMRIHSPQDTGNETADDVKDASANVNK